MTFDTFDQAQDYYYEHHDCESDDVDKEMTKIERWIELEDHKILNA